MPVTLPKAWCGYLLPPRPRRSRRQVRRQRLGVMRRTSRPLHFFGPSDEGRDDQMSALRDRPPGHLTRYVGLGQEVEHSGPDVVLADARHLRHIGLDPVDAALPVPMRRALDLPRACPETSSTATPPKPGRGADQRPTTHIDHPAPRGCDRRISSRESVSRSSSCCCLRCMQSAMHRRQTFTAAPRTGFADAHPGRLQPPSEGSHSAYSRLDEPAAVKAWSASEFGRDWNPPVCTG